MTTSRPTYHLEHHMRHKYFQAGFLFIISLFMIWVMFGCSGSDQSQKAQMPPATPTATEIVQQQLITLRLENDSLRQQLQMLGEENRKLNGRVSELSVLTDSLKMKIA